MFFFSGKELILFLTSFLIHVYQFVYWSWISNSLYHGAMGAMQGMNLNQTYDRISDVLWDTQVAQWSFVSSGSSDIHGIHYQYSFTLKIMVDVLLFLFSLCSGFLCNF